MCSISFLTCPVQHFGQDVSLGLTRFSLLGEEFYEASPYEPVTARLSDIFRLASIFSGEWAHAGASPDLLWSPWVVDQASGLGSGVGLPAGP